MVFCRDGGARDNQAGFGMVDSINDEIVIQSHQHLHEIYNRYNSHQSKAWGILGLLYLLDLTIQYREIQQIDNEMEIMLHVTINLLSNQ
jgi:hypothetical protein